ncbi:MAG: protease SohB [Pseudomonadota bacterium]
MFIELLLFIAKSLSLILLIVLGVIGLAWGLSKIRKEREEDGQVVISRINEVFDELTDLVQHEVLDKAELKALKKKKAAEEKEKEAKEETEDGEGTEGTEGEASPKRLFVLKFDGDMEASAAEELRELVTTLLLACATTDEVLVVLDSGGGYFTHYGFAAAQLERLRRAGLNLTVAVDYVAASGGYMMACVADRIIASPFAVLGSIGVYSQLPNFNRLLKKMDIDYEEHASGAYKRTLTMFGENTPEKRDRFLEEIEMTHHIFTNFVAKYRPQIAHMHLTTGETWYGEEALDLGLVDQLSTSDDYLVDKHKTGYEIFNLEYEIKKSFLDKVAERLPIAIRKALVATVQESGSGRQ